MKKIKFTTIKHNHEDILNGTLITMEGESNGFITPKMLVENAKLYKDNCIIVDGCTSMEDLNLIILETIGQGMNIVIRTRLDLESFAVEFGKYTCELTNNKASMDALVDKFADDSLFVEIGSQALDYKIGKTYFIEADGKMFKMEV